MDPTDGDSFELSCPIPISDYPEITMAHGGGGRISQMLIEKMFRPTFDNPKLDKLHDGALLDLPASRIAFTTDSFVIQPLFFPGGDIGELAVNGTVNDLACCGARPVYLSAGFILEEGFLMQDLWKIVQSMKKAADDAGVQIVTGDTKVVEKGKGDGVFINTAGVGIIHPQSKIDPASCRPGDRIILSGSIADHTVAVMSSRENLGFETRIQSDTAPLNQLTEAVLNAVPGVKVFRDATRGGLATVLNELIKASGCSARIHEKQIPVKEAVRGACEILGYDPLYLANEGKLVAVVPPKDAEKALGAIRELPHGEEASIIGDFTEEAGNKLLLTTSIGSTRIVDTIAGEQLPRIC